MKVKKLNKCLICNGQIILKKKIFKKEKKENIFNINKKIFKRELFECKNCKHFYNVHNFSKNLKNIYSSEYNKLSHKNIEKKFNFLKNLKNKKSSNYYRILFLKKFIKIDDKILDCGSGLGIFPYMMSKHKYNITALEYDKSSYIFLKKKLKQKALRSNIENYKFKNNFSFLTFNKILEHFPIENIIKILKKINNQKIYLELPSVKAKKHGLTRQEFFFEHYNIFSKTSISLLLKKLNFKILYLKDIKEVNNKYTLRIIAKKIEKQKITDK